MPTVINNPRSTTHDDGTLAFIIGITLMVILGILFFVYALPAIQNMAQQNAGQQNPAGTTNIYEVPSRMDINIDRNVDRNINTPQNQPPQEP